jgi:predicted nucleic acid-binding protein
MACTWKKSMGSSLRVLIDLNVILDVLQRRDTFYAASSRVLAGAETKLFEGWVAAHSLTTLYYLLAKHQNTVQARIIIGELLQFLSVATVDRSVIDQALALPYGDFEDAVQMAAAVQAGVTHLVTRNVRDYRAGPLPALLPAELLALL